MKGREVIVWRGGAIAASDWADDQHHRRPIPAGCRLVRKCEVAALPEHARAAAERLLAKRPTLRKLIVSL